MNINPNALCDRLVNCYLLYCGCPWHCRRLIVLVPLRSGTVCHIAVDPVNPSALGKV